MPEQTKQGRGRNSQIAQSGEDWWGTHLLFLLVVIDLFGPSDTLPVCVFASSFFSFFLFFFFLPLLMIVLLTSLAL